MAKTQTFQNLKKKKGKNNGNSHRTTSSDGKRPRDGKLSKFETISFNLARHRRAATSQSGRTFPENSVIFPRFPGGAQLKSALIILSEAFRMIRRARLVCPEKFAQGPKVHNFQ